MAFDYNEAAADALEALEEAGQPVVVHKPGAGGGYVPGVGVVPAEPARNLDGTGALFGYKAQNIDGVSVLQGDQRLLLAPQIAEPPQVGWTVTATGTTYSIVRVERVAPAGVTVLYKLQVRGA